MERSMSDTVFARFMRRIRAGDEQAARELVERYEPVVRREVRHGDAVSIIGYDAGPAAHPKGAPPPARPA
jgi:hypothetical protein